MRAIGPAVSWLCAIGMMPLRLTRPTVGLMPTRRVVARRRDDRAVGFRADRGRRQVGRDGRAGAGARAGRVAIERVRVPRLSAAAAPAAGRMRRAEVGPFAQVRLAEDDRAGLAQPLDDERVASAACRRPAPAIRRSSCMRSAVAMLSLIRIGMPCSGPRGPRLLRSASSPSAIVERVGIDLDHAAQRRAAAIDRFDAREILLRQRARRFLARLHALLQVGDGRLVDLCRWASPVAGRQSVAQSNNAAMMRNLGRKTVGRMEPLKSMRQMIARRRSGATLLRCRLARFSSPRWR